MNRLSVAVLLALCMALPASAQMYKWVDANGKVQYSDKPPPSNIKTEKLRAPPPGPTSSAPAAGASGAGGAPGSGAANGGATKDATKAGPKTTAEQEQAFRKRQLEAAKAEELEEKKQAQARAKAENCRRATAAVTQLQIGGRQQRIDSKGERVFLDDQEIAQQLAKAQEEAAAACKQN